MLVKVEPTGICERKGLVQVRFCMYLEPGDYGYEKHHIRVPERPLTEEERDNSILADLVPKVWQNSPFHNHFIYVEPETPDNEIKDIGEAHLHEAYIEWACEQKVEPMNPTVVFHESINNARQKAIGMKVSHLKEAKLERTWR